jgi:hypothetical protein
MERTSVSKREKQFCNNGFALRPFYVVSRELHGHGLLIPAEIFMSRFLRWFHRQFWHSEKALRMPVSRSYSMFFLHNFIIILKTGNKYVFGRGSAPPWKRKWRRNISSR